MSNAFQLLTVILIILLSIATHPLLALRRSANARIVSTSFLPYGGINYLINSFDYPNLLSLKEFRRCSLATQFLTNFTLLMQKQSVLQL